MAALRRYLFLLLFAGVLGATVPDPSPLAETARTLHHLWPSVRVSPADPWALKHAGLRAALAELQSRHPQGFTLVEEGTSAEGRKIPLLRVGSGPVGVLLWSQMHGDEPTATAAILDLLAWLGGHPEDPLARRIQTRLTLWIIPMLNPDGTERTQRRNAQEIDINRDALALVTPEGRFLKAVRDRVRPALGYNLHNQNPLVRVGAVGPQAALSVLSVPGDEAFTLTPGTRRSRQLAVAVQQLTAPFAPGRVARYDTDYTARAFGDSMTRWGTPTLLIETGGWAGPGEAERLVRLNFVALAGSLAAVADQAVDRLPVEAYERIPLNQRDAVASLVLRKVRLATGRGLPPYLTDLAWVVPGPFAGEAGHPRQPALFELGDLTHILGLAEVDGTGLLAVPWSSAGLDWPALQDALRGQGLAEVEEPRLLAALQQQGAAAVAKPGYSGAVLLYRSGPGAVLRLAGAVIHGRLWGLQP